MLQLPSALRASISRMPPALVLACLALLGVLWTSSVRAQTNVHVSDEFQRVARELARRYVVSEFGKLCEEGKAEADKVSAGFCKELVDGLSELVLLSTTKDVDREALGDALEGFGRNLLRAGASLLMRDAMDKLLELVTATDSAGARSVAVDPDQLAQTISACLVAQAMKGQGSEHDDERCRDLEKLSVNLPAARAGAGPAPQLDTEHALRPFHDLLQKMLASTGAGYESAEYQLAVTLNLLGKVSASFDKGAFPMALELAGHHDETASQLHANRFVRELELARGRDAVAAGGCAQGPAFVAAVDAWRELRRESVHAIGLAAARFDLSQVNVELAKVPVLPDPACAGGSKAAEAARKLALARISYSADARRAAVIGPLVAPLLTVAALADFLRTKDRAALSDQLADVSLHVLSLALAASDDSRGATCSEDGDTRTCEDVPLLNDSDHAPPCQVTAGKLRCAPPLATPFQVPKAAKLPLEMRYSAQGSRYTCVYQAVAASFGRPIATAPDAAGWCRPLAAQTTTGDMFPGMVTGSPAAAARAFRWNRAFVEPSGASFVIRFSKDERLSLDDAVALIDGVRAGLSAREQPTEDLQALLAVAEAAVHWAGALQHEASEASARPLLAQAALLLHPHVNKLLDESLAPLATCTSEKFDMSTRSTGIGCGVRVLADAAYSPMVELIAGDGSPEQRRRAAREIQKNLVTLDPLNRTPLLFNVGLGVTCLQRDRDPDVNLTLLDKLGMAWRFGNRRQWELGGFAGGFIDSLVRELADSEQEQFWLLAGTFGVREFSRGLPLGLELHAGLGVPYDLTKFADRVAAAYGLALIVPADIAFGE